MSQEIGVIGLGVMGKNLAFNIESKGFSVSVYNRSYEKTENMLAEAKGRRIAGFRSLEEFVASLERPRKILLMVQAGEATDLTLKQLLPLLEKGDLVIDGGNAYYQDTRRRSEECEREGILFLGMGVSGGEEGALHGPSLMPGGARKAYQLVERILMAIAAKAEGTPCVAYMGPDGAGHYVKMVHNGIEYGDMQLISEAYDILTRGLRLTAEELAEVFSDWNRGELDSYLIQITADILRKKDPETGNPLVEMILDRAGQKGTGRWTSQSALELGVPLSVITESVFARNLSAQKEERVKASHLIKGPSIGNPPQGEERTALVEDVRRALYASKIISYAQGFAQLKAASEAFNWNLDYRNIAMIWRGGCIIRARFLQNIMDAFEQDADLPSLLFYPYFRQVLEEYQSSWRRVVSFAVMHGIPAPAFASALAYFDSYRTERLPANLIQAQRDYFGAHTYERIDREGIFHTEWVDR